MPKQITQEYLKSILDYDPNSGVFTWKVSSKNHQHNIGDIAGCQVNHGGKTKYAIIGINKENYRANRLAFLYMTGSMPFHVDHKDRDGTNNKWDNLRSATKQTNAANTERRSDNTSGFKGISFRSDKRRVKKWRACLFKDGKQIVIGTYHTKEEAAKAYDEVVVKYFGDFAVTNKSLGLY